MVRRKRIAGLVNRFRSDDDGSRNVLHVRRSEPRRMTDAERKAFATARVEARAAAERAAAEERRRTDAEGGEE